MSQKSFPQLRVRTIIYKDGHILMARLTARLVAFLPGGRVEPGETLELAVRRELKEEAGVDNVDFTYLGCIEHLWIERSAPIHDLTHFFLAERCDAVLVRIYHLANLCKVVSMRLIALGS